LSSNKSVAVGQIAAARRFSRLGKGLRLTTAKKEQGAAGITTAAPYVAGQWGRGE